MLLVMMHDAGANYFILVEIISKSEVYFLPFPWFTTYHQLLHQSIEHHALLSGDFSVFACHQLDTQNVFWMVLRNSCGFRQERFFEQRRQEEKDRSIGPYTANGFSELHPEKRSLDIIGLEVLSAQPGLHQSMPGNSLLL